MLLSSAVHPLVGIDPEIRFGRPCIAGSRIGVRDVLNWLGNGMSVAEIIDEFPELTAEAIAAAQAYAADHGPTYSELFGREPDFRVTYRLFTAEEGGRTMPPYQTIRWDMSYAEDGLKSRMVYPEFLDPGGQPIPNGPFAPVGQANMFVLNPAMLGFHRQRVRPGVRGYFMKGRPVGVWEVAEVLGLRRLPA